MLLAIILVIVGIAILLAGGELVVRGASNLAASWGISPLMVGLTVVSLGTSAPELAVSIGAAWTPEAALVIGNVVGSNVFNTFAVLGTVALLGPLAVQRRLIRLEVPLVAVLSGLVWFMGRDGGLDRIETALLVLSLVVYMGLLIGLNRKSRTEEPDEPNEPEESEVKRGAPPSANWKDWVALGGGLVCLLGGARLAVTGAVDISRLLQVSELIIGITVVAIGTSLPELVASAIAALRGQRDIAVGNVIGSNLFNLLAVLGIAGVAAPADLPIPSAASNFDVPVMVAASVVMIPIVATGLRVTRREGVLLLLCYLTYMVTVVIRALG